VDRFFRLQPWCCLPSFPPFPPRIAAAKAAVARGPRLAGPGRVCVQKAMLTQVCGNPAGAPCKHEAAARVCFGKQSSLVEPKAATAQ